MKINVFKKVARYAATALLFGAFSVSLTNCVVHTPRHNAPRHKQIPPGRHKKMHGERSAKRYAPGQQKKANHHDNGRKNGHYKRGR